jgi:hypothetical protein
MRTSPLMVKPKKAIGGDSFRLPDDNKYCISIDYAFVLYPIYKRVDNFALNSRLQPCLNKLMARCSNVRSTP